LKAVILFLEISNN